MEGRNLIEVTHLAWLGVKIQEPAFRDKSKREKSKNERQLMQKRTDTKEEREALKASLFYIKDSDWYVAESANLFCDFCFF